jgi:molybdopterin synthase catalytic subunit
MMARAQVSVSLVDGPLGPAEPWAVAGAGALLHFEGVVRPTEDGRALTALEYEAYEPMARQQLDALARQVVEQRGLLALDVRHSRGRVPVGLVSFRLRVAASHRDEALAAMGEFIDRMKRDVPIWKNPVFDERRDADQQPPSRRERGAHSP